MAEHALTSVDVAEMAGISYRQLDHWHRAGYICSSGNEWRAREWDSAAAARVVAVAALVRLGFPVSRAVELLGQPAGR